MCIASTLPALPVLMVQWTSHLAALTEQLIVNGQRRDPLGLASLGSSGDREEGDQVCGALVRVKWQELPVLVKTLARVLEVLATLGVAIHDVACCWLWVPGINFDCNGTDQSSMGVQPVLHGR